MKNWKNKIKVHIEISLANRLLMAIALFVLVDTIFLLVIILTQSQNSVVNNLISLGYSDKTANFYWILSTYGAYATDILIVFVFMVSILIGRNKIEYGNFYVYFWIVLFLIIGLFPFASPSNNNLSYIKNSSMLVPITLFIWALVIHANEVRWLRKKHEIIQERRKYV